MQVQLSGTPLSAPKKRDYRETFSASCSGHRRRLAGICDQKTQFERNLLCCTAVAIPALEMVFQHSTVNSCVGNDFPVPQNQLQRWKRFSCTAKSTPRLEIIFLHSNVNSRAGNHFPLRQSQLQCRKRFSCTAKSTPRLEIIFPYGKVSSSAGNDFPVRQSQLQYWKSFSCTAR